MKVILSTPPRDGIVIVDGESTQPRWVHVAMKQCEADHCRGGEVQYPEWEGRTEPCPDCLNGRPLVEFLTLCETDTCIFVVLTGRTAVGPCDECHDSLISLGPFTVTRCVARDDGRFAVLVEPVTP